MEISNPDKVMFPEPGHTKADLAAYYASVAERMLPWLVGRPLTLERHPNGVAEKGFMQKNASAHFSDHIERVEVPKTDGTVTHPVVRDTHGLLELANQGTITFHVWTSSMPELDEPTHLLLDLDPEAGDVDAVREVAHRSREILRRFGHDGTLVASGRKGFHIWVPISGAAYDEVGLAARALAGLIAAENEGVATVEFLKKNRQGRVFVDWLRNRRAQSIVCPWSVRVTPTASVATPLLWDELDAALPNGWDITSAPDRSDISSGPAAHLDTEAIVTAARHAGVDLDSDFDRFGR